jgi:hypothetical protein
MTDLFGQFARLSPLVALGLVGSLAAPRLCVADAAYDSDGLRGFLITQGTLPVIPNNPTLAPIHLAAILTWWL